MCIQGVPAASVPSPPRVAGERRVEQRADPVPSDEDRKFLFVQHAGLGIDEQSNIDLGHLSHLNITIEVL